MFEFLTRLLDERGELLGPPVSDLIVGAPSESLSHEDVFQRAAYALYNPINVNVPDVYADSAYMSVMLPGHVGYDPVRENERQFACLMSRNLVRGPFPGCADIVVVGKHPASVEETTGHLFSGPSGLELKSALLDAGVPDLLDRAYFTNICRFVPPPDKWRKSWARQCDWLLWAELVLIRPKFVLVLGSEASQYLFGPRATIGKTRGAVHLYALPHADGLELPCFCTVHPAAVAHEPSQRVGLSRDLARFGGLVGGQVRTQLPCDHRVLSTAADVRGFVNQRIGDDSRLFAIDCEWSGRSVWSGGKLLTIQISWAPGKAVLIPIHRHPRIPVPYYFLRELAEGRPVDRFIDRRVPGMFVLQDACFGDVVARRKEYEYIPMKSDVLLCVQPVAPEDDRPDTNLPFEVLNRLIPAHDDDELALIVGELRRLFFRDGVRVGGHNFRADHPWLKALGIDLIDLFVGGFDTMLKHHILHESSAQDLTTVHLKYTDVDRYDMRVFDLLDRMKAFDDLGGFGCVPEAHLYPYALFDADVTFRINIALDNEIARREPEERDGILEALQGDMRACLGIAEIEETGMLVDRERLLELTAMYAAKRDELDEALRARIRWPDFNHRSVFDVRELLFGEQYSGRKAADGQRVAARRPPGAACCLLTPIKSTGKRSRDWQKIVDNGDEKKFSPSTNKETLGILSASSDVAKSLRDIRFVDQVVKLYTAPPETDPETGETIEAGLMRFVDPDGRIRTRIFQATETGRWSSSSPNLQNIPSRREPHLHALFPGRKVPKIRSIFVAPPGYVMISADYSQAELIVLAILSGDTKFYETLTERRSVPVLVDRNTGAARYWLHPDYVRNVRVAPGDAIAAGSCLGDYRFGGEWKPLVVAEPLEVVMRPWPRDLHAERAISGFNLPYCAVEHGPPKAWVENGHKDLRISAKTVNFGIPYGRGAPAIAFEIRQEGVTITETRCQSLIDGFHQDFQSVSEFLSRCEHCVTGVGKMVNPFGRWRRFYGDVDRGKLSDQEREADNFPIQSTVAECLNRAAYNFVDARRELCRRGIPLDYRLVLGVHDAAILQVAVGAIRYMMAENGVVEWAMCANAAIPMPDRNICNGLYRNVVPEMFPYRLSVNSDIFLRWDESPSREALAAVGVPDEYLPEE